MVSPMPTVPRQLEEPLPQPSAHYYVTSYGTTTFGPSSIQVTQQVRQLPPPQHPPLMSRLVLLPSSCHEVVELMPGWGGDTPSLGSGYCAPRHGTITSAPQRCGCFLL